MKKNENADFAIGESLWNARRLASVSRTPSESDALANCESATRLVGANSTNVAPSWSDAKSSDASEFSLSSTRVARPALPARL